MKFKIGLLAAAAGLVFASASASAAISYSGGVYDMVFMAWDGNGNSYARDLGNQANLPTANESFNVASGSVFASTFSVDSASQISWAVVALDSDNGNIYTTGNPTIITNNLNNADGVQTDVPQNESAAQSGWVAFNAIGTNAAGEYIGTKSNAPSNPTYGGNLYRLASANSPVVAGVGVSQNWIYEDASNTGTVYQLYTNPALSNSNFGGGANGGYFTLTDAAGDLTWTDTVSSVPLPAAAFLFFPALLGMFGLGRRRNQA